MLSPTEEIKSKVDIVDIVQEYVQLKQSGANFKGSCPFHNEKTPSFMVSRENQFFKCFGCAEGGDIFTFLQKIEGIESPEALRILADKAGVELKTQNFNPQMQNLKTRLYELHQLAVNFYAEQLFQNSSGKKALEYLTNSRKLEKTILEKFKIGYAPDSWDALNKFLSQKGFSDNEIKQSGLVVEKNSVGRDGKNYYDRFRDRIMFPILDHHSNIVGFTARTMKADEQAKYINTPQTIIYNKSQILYGLDKAKNEIRKNNFVILVEGNMDVIASHKGKMENVVASSGTSLTQDQLTLLKRYTKNLVFCFDADEAGLKAGERGIQLAWQNEMNVKVISLPQEIKDPDELISKNPNEWIKVVNSKINFMDFLLEKVLANQNIDDVNVKKTASEKLLTWLSKLENPVEKEHYLKVFSEKLKISQNALSESLSKIKINPNYSQNQNPKTQQPQNENQNQTINKKKEVSRRILALAFFKPEYLPELIDKLQPEMFDIAFQELYKNLIYSYTKSREINLNKFYESLKAEKTDLAFVFDTLKLFAESEFEEMTKSEVNSEFNLLLQYLKKENITQRLKEIENLIRSAEQSGNRSQADKLMKEFSELSRELSGF